MAQQLGFVLTAFPDFLKATFRVTAHRKDIVGSCKHVDLAQAELAVDDLDNVQHREEGIPVLLDLRSLVAVTGVLHRERMQAELRLHVLENFRIRVAQRHPHEAIRLTDILVNLVGWNVGHLPAVAI